MVLVWQLVFVFNFPDGDTDAYAHFIIARDIVRNPHNLSLHWVWLPLFHYIGALFVCIGAEMQAIRFLNIIVWASIPFLIYYYLRAKNAESDIPVISSLVCAIFPLGILMGTTAQPEPLFSLSILLFVVFFDREKFILSSVFLSIACMLRYEAWAVLGFVSLYLIYLIIRKKTIKTATNYVRLYFVIFLPVILILIWTFLRYESDGRWFAFLHGTMQFANDALGETNSAQGGFMKVLNDLFFYPFWVPFLFTGIVVFAVPFGFKEFFRNNKILFISGLGILLFITFSWVFKSNLGLNRHFTSLIPMYSVMIAYGINSLILIAGKFKKNCKHGIIVDKLLSRKSIMIITTVIMLFYSLMWLYIWKEDNNKNFQGRFGAAEFIKSVPGNSIIINNDPMIEVFSKLDYRRFDHFWMSDSTETLSYIESMTKRYPEVYVVKNSIIPYSWKGRADLIYEVVKDDKSDDVIRVFRFRRTF
ncbi:MAG: hypothetical protein PHN88_13245 [Ignavibacteria bacterium]|nr:hypothetical protein [Ignavibacteria bacterium]